MNGLQAQLSYAVAAFRLELALAVSEGATHVLLGESGAGKSIALRLLAGLLRPHAGRIALDGEVYDDVERGVHEPPEARAIGYVFPQGRLFPHLTACQNIAFPLRAAGTGGADARRIARGWLERLGIAALGDRLPGSLSGGEVQRVALARALARRPRLLLLDEPLASLDVQTRHSVRAALRQVLEQERKTTVLVTHDYLDAAVFGHQVQVLEQGRVVQEGNVLDLIVRPRSSYVAALAGMNVWRGEAKMLEPGFCEVRVEGAVFRATGEASGAAFIAVAPGHVTLHRQRPEGSARNVMVGRVTQAIPLADRVRVTLTGEGGVTLSAEVTRQAAAELGLTPGAAVYAAFKATEAHVYR